MDRGLEIGGEGGGEASLGALVFGDQTIGEGSCVEVYEGGRAGERGGARLLIICSLMFQVSECEYE